MTINVHDSVTTVESFTGFISSLEPAFLLPESAHVELIIDRNSKDAYSSRFTAPYTGSVNVAYPMGFIPDIGSATAIFNVGIQSDSSGNPSGIWLGATQKAYGSKNIAFFDRLTPIPLQENASLVAGNVYHVVVQDSGLGILDSNNRAVLQPLASKTNIIYWDNDWPGLKRIDNNTALMQHTTGGLWSESSIGGHLSNNAYAIQYTDGRVWGQPYSSNDESDGIIAGANMVSQVLDIRFADYTIATIAVRVQRGNGGLHDGSIPLEYEIRDSNETVLRTGVLYDGSDINEGGIFWWREATLSSPLNLVHGNTYRLVFKFVSGDTVNNSYQAFGLFNGLGDLSNDDLLQQLNYGGGTSYTAYTSDSGATWQNAPQDLSFYLGNTSVTRVFAGLPAVIETLVTSENTSVTLSIPTTFDLHLNDSVHVVDKPVYYDDTVFLSESQNVIIALGINVFDSTTLFELILLPSAGNLNINETVTTNESLSTSLLILTNQNESVSVLESTTIIAGSMIINIHDSQSVFDDAIMGNPDLSNSVDNVVVEEENILVMESDLESVFDQVNIIDVVLITVVFTALISVTDSVGLSESVSLTIQTSVFVNVNDFEIVNELLLFTSDILVVTHDTGSASDQVNIFPESLNCFTSDSSIVTEKVSFGVGFRVSVQDRTIASEYRWFPETPVVLGFIPGGATNDGS